MFILSFICMHVFSVRPQEGSSKPAGRGVLSMTNLSHGVIRVDTGEKLSILTLQDVGTAMPGGMNEHPQKAFLFRSNIYLVKQPRAVQRCFPHVTTDLIKRLYGSRKTDFSPSLSAMVCAVKLEGVPQLCKTDEIGEICVSSVATGTSYYGLTGMSKNTFEV